jgi:large subunit ribosomal protein L19
MHPAVATLTKEYAKPAIPQVQSGDTVRVHQRIREGNKQRIQMFEGVVIRTHRMNEASATITVRRIASGVGVEKTYLLHSPNVDKVEIMRRGRVRRNFLSYLRQRRGKSARLQELAFDKAAANQANVVAAADEIPADDASVTELDAEEVEDELNQSDVSIDEVVKEENKEAAAEDASSSDGGDESELGREEAESKIDKPDSNN